MIPKDGTHCLAVSLLVTVAVIWRLAAGDLRRCFSSCVVYIQHLTSDQLLLVLQWVITHVVGMSIMYRESSCEPLRISQM